MMINPDEIFVCEYSANQRCFHVHTLAEALEKNRRGIARGCKLDYIPFALSDDFHAANEICNEMRKRILPLFHQGNHDVS